MKTVFSLGSAELLMNKQTDEHACYSGMNATDIRQRIFN